VTKQLAAPQSPAKHPQLLLPRLLLLLRRRRHCDCGAAGVQKHPHRQLQLQKLLLHWQPAGCGLCRPRPACVLLSE
jgi:hypothetical protein